MPGNAPSSAARVAWCCVAALLVFCVWLVAGSSASAGIGFFYAVPIGLASWWGGWRWGAIAALACCCLYIVGALIHPVPHYGVALAIRVVVFAGVIGIVAALRDRLSVLEHSVEELEAIRAALTPSTLPELPDVDAAAAFVPSEYGVSGDFYLLTNGPDGTTVAVIGDVVGHGPEAARLATFVRARFAALAANTSDPAELLMHVNAALVDRPGREKELVSAACLRFRAEGTVLSWATAGHPSPLQLSSLEALWTEVDTSLLGVSAELSLATVDTRLSPAGGVVAYTDGATDVRRTGALLGLEGFTRLLAPLVRLPAGSMVREAEKAILEWADEPVRDDLCILVLKPKRDSI